MELQQEGISFGDFSDLCPEEAARINSILHGGPRNPSKNLPKFPWGDQDIEFQGQNFYDDSNYSDSAYQNGPDFYEDVEDQGDVGFQLTVDQTSPRNSPVKMPPVIKASQEQLVAVEVTDPVVTKDDVVIPNVDQPQVAVTEQNGMEVGDGKNPELEVESPPKSKPSSWAGLFKNSQPANVSHAAASKSNSSMKAATPPRESKTENTCDADASPVQAADDKASKEIAGLLQKITLNNRPKPIQPRGLVNRGNWCYVNATLQALVACPQFFHMIKSLPAFPPLQRGPSSTPVIDSFVEFVNEFEYLKPVPSPSKVSKKDRQIPVNPGVPFEPANIYKMLQRCMSTDAFKYGKQEDAEEFLTYILNAIHEEMVATSAVLKEENSPEVPETNGFNDEGYEDGEVVDEWEQVGPKKKSVITRKANFENSSLSDLFCGQIRSVLQQSGSRESATLEPFFTLKLDIQGNEVWTVEDALNALVTRESLQGFTCTKTKQEVEATRRTYLEALPPILILHLKYFVYEKDGGCQKLFKKVDYPVDLEIPKSLLSPNTKNKLTLNQRSYKLLAVVYHHGKHAVGGGHYTTCVFHQGLNGWISIDDSIVRDTSVNHVLKFLPNRVPYLLYYRRCDHI